MTLFKKIIWDSFVCVSLRYCSVNFEVIQILNRGKCSVNIPGPFEPSFDTKILKSNSHSVKWKHEKPHEILLKNIENKRSHMEFHSRILKTRETTLNFISKFLFLVKFFEKYVKVWLNLKSKSRIHNALQKKKSYKDDIYKYHRQKRKKIVKL